MRRLNDAFGHMLYDCMNGESVAEVIERDDGYITVAGTMALYLAEHEKWHETDKQAMKFAKGRVLDIGCGAGRHAIYLQRQGIEVTGIDSSPLAVYVSQRRGLENARVQSITQVKSALGDFDTLLLLGNNFGLMANTTRAKWLLRRFKGLTSATGRIVASSSDPYGTDDGDHLAYFERNRSMGRLPGQVRIRYRYKRYKDDWFDYLFVSKKEMEEIVAGTGWQIDQFIDSDDARYLAILEKHRP